MKLIVAIAFIGIIGALFAAGLFMLKRGGKTPGSKPNMARALTVRIGLSVALFLFILVSYLMGWIQPTGLPVGH
ncbi:twin transmembrane helix small protein [Paucibacter sp. APW11]|uniref:Twin transmembrane helix small protein n=1 Tax=Roseateles aquae TaxID=3077235 RepID=A0ABU3PFA7_9BURK|nr:twin transmembrane helix small protein [Paucibacter sp. APW11]MDT9001214.1 twin transmembrane helix small protein [Paucibacter sp. APW11]